MEIDKLINEVRADIERLRRAIACLERLRDDTVDAQSRAPTPRDRRGRKSMGPEERKEVSARMKRYWESRRRS